MDVRATACLKQSKTRSQVIPTASPTSRLSQSGISTLPAQWRLFSIRRFSTGLREVGMVQIPQMELLGYSLKCGFGFAVDRVSSPYISLQPSPSLLNMARFRSVLVILLL